MAQTVPAVYIPSTKMLTSIKLSKYCDEILPNTNERKNPTQVDVQSGQEISSPKKLEFIFIQFLGFSNIAP